MATISELLSQELGQKLEYIENVINLMDEGNTIPFIARYRKELHGAMDDTTLRNLETRLNYLRNLQQRRDEVKNSIENQGKLTEELSAAIDAATTLAEVEDLYRPYKQKRRTRGSVAREKGLEPLAAALFAQDGQDPNTLAQDYVDPEKGVNSVEEALAGASDIIAEDLSDDAEIRKALRQLVTRKGLLVCKAEDAENDSVYRLYYDFSQPISKGMDHQILAINRGEKEELLKVTVALPGNEGAALVCRAALKPTLHISAFVRSAAEDAYERLIFPSIQREVRSDLSERAYAGAIHNFALNLKPLLMQPPVKGFVTMGLDPGYRNGCKVAVVDATGKVLDTAVVYPTFSERKKQEAIDTSKTYTDEQIEDLYRTTLFLKAMSNITNATLKSMNEMFMQYFTGQLFVYEYDTMKLRVVVRFPVTKIEKAIFTNLLPKPTGVLLGFEFLQPQEFFGFNVQGLPADEQPYAPADQKPFYW